MEREIDTVEALARFLTRHGYPRESLFVEWPVGPRLRVDLAVVDPQTNKPVALFEVKRHFRRETLNMALAQLKAYSQAAGDTATPTYIVFPGGPEGVRIFRADVNDGEASELEEIPDYEMFRRRGLRVGIDTARTEKKRAIDFLWLMAGILGLGCLILLIGDMADWWEVTAIRLAMAGLVCGLFLLPFAGKLKVAGLEFERYRGLAETLEK